MAGLLSGYSSTITDAASKKRYTEKLELVDGIDPYEVAKGDWQDDGDLWLAITQLQVCMYVRVLTQKRISSTTKAWTATRILCEAG